MQVTDNRALERENEKILEKFNFLVEKYHQYDNAVLETQGVVDAETVPVLTERIRLRMPEAQSEFGELSPLRLLLDAALRDADIALSQSERQALVHALENRILVQEKEFLS